MGLDRPKMKIGFWNARSIKHKINDLKLFLDKEIPTVVVVNETWLKRKDIINIRNYSTLRQDREGNRGGGLLFLIKSGITYKKSKLTQRKTGFLETMCIEVLCNQQCLKILLVYNPCQNVPKEEFTHFFEQTGPHALIIGDFNGHHPSWSTNRTHANPTGDALHAAIMEQNHLLLMTTPGLTTRVDPGTGKSTTLDLVIGSGSLAMGSVITGQYMGSDHLPVLISYKIDVNTPSITKSKWRIKEKMLPRFQESNNCDVELGEDPVKNVDILTSEILSTGEKFFIAKKRQKKLSLVVEHSENS